MLPRHFSTSVVELLIRWFLRYIDDGFILWPRDLPIDNFLRILNSLDPHLRFTLEASKKYFVDNDHFQELSFLDILTILKNYRIFTTDIFYKATNHMFNVMEFIIGDDIHGLGKIWQSKKLGDRWGWANGWSASFFKN